AGRLARARPRRRQPHWRRVRSVRQHCRVLERNCLQAEVKLDSRGSTMASSSSGGRSGTHTMVCTCLRAQFYRELSALRLELHDGLDAVRQEMATLRADME